MRDELIPSPTMRWSFVAAFALAITLQLAAIYIRATQHPTPAWTHSLAPGLFLLVLGLYFLRYPQPRLTMFFRLLFAAVAFGFAALELITFFAKG